MPSGSRLRGGRSAYDLILKSNTSTPIGLMLDRTDKAPVRIPVRHVPIATDQATGIQVREWQWENGKAGAGYARETAASRENGGSAHGENVWLRRLGVAQPAGQVEELNLPALTGAFTSGWPSYGQVFGTNNDLYVTTRNRTVVKVPNGTGSTALAEQDFGGSGITVGIAVFNGSGTACLYIGDSGSGVHELNGSTWSTGAAGTERIHLATVSWNISEALASGGLAGTAGTSASRLVGVKTDGTGFYHVAGDPKVAANWSALTNVGVGGSVFPVLGLASSNHVVWFGTGLGVLGANELGETPNLTKWVESIAGQAASLPITYWNGLVWFATDYGLVAFEPSGERVDLGNTLNFGAKHGVSPVYGRPTCLAPCPDGLYVGYYNRETTTGYVGCLLLDDASGAYRWSMAEAVLAGIQPTYVQQVNGHDGNPRLFIGGVDTSGLHHLYRQSLPKSGDPETDVVHGGPFVASEAWSVTLSSWDAETPNPKTLRRFMTQYDYVGSDWPANTLTFETSVDGGAFATQGTATEVGRWTATPVAGSVSGTRIQVRLSVTNAATAPVVIYSAGVRYSVRPETTKVRSYPVIVGENVALRTGVRDARDPYVVLQRAERALQDGPITIYDRGRTFEGIVEDVQETEAEEREGDGWTVRALITISQSRNATLYDRGDGYDEGYPYS